MHTLTYLFFFLFVPGIWSSGIKNVSKFAIDEKPMLRMDEHLQGIWKMVEDTDAHNYFIIEKDGDFAYSITYMNRSGDNRGLEHGRFFWSETRDVKFINISNWDDEHPGFVLFKVNGISKGSWNMTLSMVIDSSIQKVDNRADLRILLSKNINNPSFYGKELHFKKKFEFNSFK
jgi:hypothetical protein